MGTRIFKVEYNFGRVISLVADNAKDAIEKIDERWNRSDTKLKDDIDFDPINVTLEAEAD